MPITITMPALSPTMTEGKLANWQVKEGDSVSSGDVLAEIETDKATMEVEAVDEGIIGKILVPGDTEDVAVNTPIAILLEEGEDASALDGFDSGAATTPTAAASAPAEASAPAATTVPAPAAPVAVSGNRVFSSPLARRIAANNNIDLAQVSGSGPKGRIVKADVEKAIASGGTAAVAPAPQSVAAPVATTAPATLTPPPAGDYVEIPLNNMRKTIARRLTEAKQEIPHFYLTIDMIT